MSSQWLQILVAAFLFSVGHGRDIIEERIYGGKTASSGEFPYHALIAKYYSDVNTTICGGALITVLYVLTAATCVVRGSALTVFLGLTDMYTYDETNVYKIADKDSFIPHEKFNPITLENDIGLLKLPRKAKLSVAVKTIAVPPLSWTEVNNNNVDKFSNAAVYVTGFGKSQHSECGIQTSRELQFINISVHYHYECAKEITPYVYSDINTILCVRTSRRGPCSQDEGGPAKLVSTTADARYVLGIFSRNVGGCGTFEPAIFTYVGSFIQWIQDKIGS